MNTIRYSELRQIARNADGLFFEGPWRQSRLIRWWTNDCPHWFWRWFSLAPFSHAELVVWDAVVDHPPGGPFDCYKAYPNPSNVRLCGWGSVDGGPRKTPLWRLVQSYVKVGGRVYWAPLIEGWKPSLDVRGEIISRANEAWGSHVHYPNLRQWARTACRNWFKEPDTDPAGFTCWEFVAYCLGLVQPTAWYGKEIAECGLFGELREIVLDEEGE